MARLAILLKDGRDILGERRGLSDFGRVRGDKRE
jgi:hypothetical protein